MKKALIVFGSTTGNTESVAEHIAQVLAGQGVEAIVKNVDKTRVEELGKDVDVTLLGCSTWGDAEIEFQEDFTVFYQQMDKADLQGKKVALFGCGDSSYEHFCGAVDLLAEKSDTLGAKMVNEPLRIDGDPQGVLVDITSWAQEVAGAL